MTFPLVSLLCEYWSILTYPYGNPHCIPLLHETQRTLNGTLLTLKTVTISTFDLTQQTNTSIYCNSPPSIAK